MALSTEGVDYSFARPGGLYLAAAGKKFAARYLWPNTKGITPAEIADLRANGLAICVVYEEDGRELLEGFAGGVRIATRAQQLLVATGLSPQLPIYFAVDFDAQLAQQAVINEALNGCASVIGLNRVGLYAGFNTLQRAVSAGVVTWQWQTYAWSQGRLLSTANLYQYSNGHMINGGAVDFTRALTAEYGQSPVTGEEGFLMALTAAQQQELYDTVVGIWGVVAQPVTRDVPDPDNPGKKKTVILAQIQDNADTNTLVRDLTATVASLRAAVSALSAASGVDPAAIQEAARAGAVDALKGLTFRAE